MPSSFPQPQTTVIVANPTSGIPPAGTVTPAPTRSVMPGTGGVDPMPSTLPGTVVPTPSPYGAGGSVAAPAAPSASGTPMAVEVVGYAQVVPTMTPPVAASILVLIVLYLLVYLWLGNTERLVLGGAGLVVAVLVVLTGSPQYALGWFLLAIGLSIASFFLNLGRKGGL